jgi:hypothetical protein
MIRRILAVSAVAVSLAVAHGPQGLLAQQTAPPKSAPATQPKAPAAATSVALASMPLVGITVVQIKPELLTEWQDFQKSEVVPTLQKGGIKQRSVFVTTIGPSFQYAIITPIESYAERDGESPIVKALGQDGARAFGQKNRRFIASQRTFTARVRTDLSYRPDMNAQLPVAVISDYTIAAGRAADFEAYIKTDLMPAHQQLKTGGFAVYQGQFGGEGNTFVVATLLHNFAELDKGPATLRAYGQARATAIQQKLAGIVTHVERTVVRALPDYGFRPRTTSDDR